MVITHCKLKKSTLIKLLECFVPEVTARAAADIIEMHPNSTALFYKIVRQIISYNLELEAKEVFNGDIEIDESIFVGDRKGKRGRRSIVKTIVFGSLKR